MTKDEALKLALEALINTDTEPLGASWRRETEAIAAIKEALAQPEQICGFDVVLDESMPPNTFKLAQPEHSPNCALLKIPSKDCDCQDQQKPVAITITGKLGNIYSFTGDYSLKKGDKVYTTPPQRKPLTDEEIILIVAECAASHQHTDIHFARAIEAAHGIKELV